MKRNVLVVMLLVAGMMMRAEVTHNIGVQVGWERQLLRLNQPSVLNDDKSALGKQPLNGGRIGLVYELTHETGVSLLTAINYSYTWHRSKWQKIPYTEGGKATTFDYNKIEYQYYSQAHMLDINLHAQYKFEIAGETYLVLYTGPSFQYIGKYKAEDYFRYNDQEINVRYYFEDKLEYNAEQMGQYYKRWNVTWGLGAAFQFDRYYIRGGYDFGLVNPYNISCFGIPTYEDNTPVFPKTNGSHYPDDRLTRGRWDSWNITLGVFIWQSDK